MSRVESKTGRSEETNTVVTVAVLVLQTSISGRREQTNTAVTVAVLVLQTSKSDRSEQQRPTQ